MKNAVLLSTFLIVMLVAAGTAVQAVTIDSINDAEIDQHVNWNAFLKGIQTSWTSSGAYKNAHQWMDVGRLHDEYTNPVVGPSRWGLVKFDVSGIAPATTVDNATLKVIQTVGIGFNPTTDVYAVNVDWNEGTADADPPNPPNPSADAFAVNGVCWNNFVGTAGSPSYNPVDDFLASGSVTFLGTMVNNMGQTIFANDNLTALVQDWIDGSHGSYGLLLAWQGAAPTDGLNDLCRYATHESQANDPPQIIINDTVEDPDPIIPASATLYMCPVVGNDSDNLAYANLDAYQSGEDYYDESTTGPPGRVYDASTNPLGSMRAFAEASGDNTTAYIDVWVWTQNHPSWAGGSFIFTVSGGKVAPAAGGSSPKIHEVAYANHLLGGASYQDNVSFVSEAFGTDLLYPTHVEKLNDTQIAMGGGMVYQSPAYPHPSNDIPLDQSGTVRFVRIGLYDVSDIGNVSVTTEWDPDRAASNETAPGYCVVNCWPYCGDQNYPYPAGDLNRSCNVNWSDFAIFAGHWLDSGCTGPGWCGGADMDQSGSVNWGDFSIFAAHWLEDQVDSITWDRKKKAAQWRRRQIIFNNDGDDVLSVNATTPETFLASRTTPLVGSQVDSIFYCSGRTTTVWRDTEVGYFLDLGISEELITQYGRDCLQIQIDFCRDNDIEIFWSMRMNDIHDSYRDSPSLASLESALMLFSSFKQDHPEYLMGEPSDAYIYPITSVKLLWSALDYSFQGVRDHIFQIIQEVCQGYDIDGIELDFERSPIFFLPTSDMLPVEQNHLDMMTDLMRSIREMTETVGLQRDRPLLIAVRIPLTVERSEFLGLDVKTWLEEDLVDILIDGEGYLPMAMPIREMVQLGHQYEVPVYPCITNCSMYQGGFWGSGSGPDLLNFSSIEAWRGAAMNIWNCGSDGVYLFNCFIPYSPIWHELGSPDTLAGIDKIYAVDYVDIDASLGEAKTSLPTEGFLPVTLVQGETVSVDLPVGEDIQSEDLSELTLYLHLNQAASDIITVKLNGTVLSNPNLTDGWLEFPLNATQIQRGDNNIELILNAPTGPPLLLDGVQLMVRYQ